MKVAKYLPRFRQAYRNLELLSERERWTRQQIEAFQLQRVNAVWRHARQHVAHYRVLAERLGLPEEFSGLEQFRTTMPVLEKRTVRDAPLEFLSNVPERGFWTRTGGSTGTPMKCYWGREAHREMLRTKYRFYDAWGVDFFDRTVYIWGHSASFAPGLVGRVARYRQPLEDCLRNRLRLSAYRLDPQNLRRYLRQIADFRPSIVYGYSSALHLLAAEAEATGFQCDTLRLFTLTGEPAVGACVSDIQRVFGVPAAIEYGSIECGAIAGEWPDRKLRVREDVVLVETRPRADGRYDILVTILNNPSFPLFRYAIGDVTDAPLVAPEEGFAILGQVSGRNNDYIQTPSGGRIHSSRFDAFFKYEAQSIRRFRLHQLRDGSIQASVELRPDAPPPDLVELATKLRVLVEGVRVTVEAVDELPHTSAGKHRQVTSDIPPLSSAWARTSEKDAATVGTAQLRAAGTPLGTPALHDSASRQGRVGGKQKAAVFRQLLQSPELTFIMEAHNGLSARIAEEAGFAALWASGLSISAALGLRDANEASWTQVLDILEYMSDATTVPILVDGDTGHGNFNNARRLIRKLEQRNLAGVCIEDKLFPKMNSFLHGESQPLADMHEFCGRIKAGKDAQSCDDFVIVARCEALIAGWGMDEAMRRAEAYHRAGADAILIHSARSNAAEVVAFKQQWGDRSPVIIVPTKYFNTPTEVFRQHRFSAVIWANHLMRSCITAMQQTAQQIHEDVSLCRVEPRIASLAEVFRLQNVAELETAERRYLPGFVRGDEASLLEEVSS